jgi:putative oxidoreductase
MKNTNMGYASRSLIALLFIVSGLNMAWNFQATVDLFTSMNMPMPQVLLAIVLLVKIGGGIVYAMGGKRYAKEAGYALIAFTVVATLVGHTSPLDQNNVIQILKNVAIIGGLLATLPCVCGGVCPMCKDCEVKKV